MNVKAKSYTLYNPNGTWLGQIVLTSDGMFSAVTDYGNFSFTWRAFGEDFREFLCQTNMHYFAGKMSLSMAYVLKRPRELDKPAMTFTEHILPPLQEVLKKELADGVEW